MVKLHPAARDRLVKLLGMLGSDFAGERAAAALKASSLLRECGLCWNDVIASPPSPSAHQRPHPACNMGPSHVVTVLWALNHDGPLTEWERGFLRGIARRPSLSPKQHESLQEIVGRLEKLGAHPEQDASTRSTAR